MRLEERKAQFFSLFGACPGLGENGEILTEVKIMKSMLAGILCLAMAVALASCGSGSEAQNEAASPAVEQTQAEASASHEATEESPIEESTETEIAAPTGEIEETVAPTGATEEISAPSGATEEWKALNNTSKAWFALTDSSLMDTRTIHVGKTEAGDDIFAFLRHPLKGTWMADEVQSAKLILKPAGNAPASLRIGFVNAPYNSSSLTREEALPLVEMDSLRSVKVEPFDDGWVSVDVTEYVKTWLSAEINNNGFALFGEETGDFVFEVVDWLEDGKELPYPYMIVTGDDNGRSLEYGKFGYTETPFPGDNDDQGGNCLSYALRDTNMILGWHLGLDFDEMNRIMDATGEDDVCEYVGGKVEEYVKANADGLKISSFRRIEDYGSEIDLEKEYRIALRVGCKIFEGQPADLESKGAFDFHVRAQINDGRWAQKFPLDPSAIIPGSGPGISPAKYCWDSAVMWLEKFRDFYTSKVIYFAVQKDTPDFTRHESVVQGQAE
jgi:hypothetical protein